MLVVKDDRIRHTRLQARQISPGVGVSGRYAVQQGYQKPRCSREMLKWVKKIDTG